MYPYQRVFQILSDKKGRNQTGERHEYLSSLLSNSQLLGLVDPSSQTNDSETDTSKTEPRKSFPFATEKGSTLLHMACHAGNWDLLEDILSFRYEHNGEDVYPFVEIINELDSEGETVCHYLVKANKVDTLGSIFEKFSFGINPFVLNRESETLCEVANYAAHPTDASLGNMAMVKLFARQQCFIGTTLTELDVSITEDMEVLALGSFLDVDEDHMPHTRLIHSFDDYGQRAMPSVYGVVENDQGSIDVPPGNKATPRQLTDGEKRLYSHRLAQAFNALCHSRVVVMASYKQFIALDGAIGIRLDREGLLEFNKPTHESLEKPLHYIATLAQIAKLQEDLGLLLRGLNAREKYRRNITGTLACPLAIIFIVMPLTIPIVTIDIWFLYYLFALSDLHFFDTFWHGLLTIIGVPVATILATLTAYFAVAVAGLIIASPFIGAWICLYQCVLENWLKQLEQEHDLDITAYPLKIAVVERLFEGQLLREVLAYLEANPVTASRYQRTIVHASQMYEITFANAKQLVEELQAISAELLQGADFLQDAAVKASLEAELRLLQTEDDTSSAASLDSETSSASASDNSAHYPQAMFNRLRRRLGEQLHSDFQELQEVVVEHGEEEDDLLRAGTTGPGYGAVGTTIH
ncbi:MAG: hypothetical protein CMF50_03055 [Legionellales bacterium]|nr:hypothetical protein [Legionellales bacterium]|tara:strand:- start:15771 stop:17684 length:1914 start_codon:yes stop_codon:yes gene_type:complete